MAEGLRLQRHLRTFLHYTHFAHAFADVYSIIQFVDLYKAKVEYVRRII